MTAMGATASHAAGPNDRTTGATSSKAGSSIRRARSAAATKPTTSWSRWATPAPTRTTRRALAEIKDQWRLGNARVHRPWITELGLWLQYDFADGPLVAGRRVALLVAWLAWSRYRVVIALRDRTAPSVFAGLDRIFRIVGGAPTYLLTDDAGRHATGVQRQDHVLDLSQPAFAFRQDRGGKCAVRSRGTSRSTGPAVVSTVLRPCPFAGIT